MFQFEFQLMLEIRRQEQLEKMKGKEIVQAISMAVAATRLAIMHLLYPFKGSWWLRSQSFQTFTIQLSLA